MPHVVGASHWEPMMFALAGAESAWRAFQHCHAAWLRCVGGHQHTRLRGAQDASHAHQRMERHRWERLRVGV